MSKARRPAPLNHNAQLRGNDPTQPFYEIQGARVIAEIGPMFGRSGPGFVEVLRFDDGGGVRIEVYHSKGVDTVIGKAAYIPDSYTGPSRRESAPRFGLRAFSSVSFTNHPCDHPQ